MIFLLNTRVPKVWVNIFISSEQEYLVFEFYFKNVQLINLHLESFLRYNGLKQKYVGDFLSHVFCYK